MLPRLLLHVGHSQVWARAVPPQDPGASVLRSGPMRSSTGQGLIAGVGCLGKLGQDWGHQATLRALWQLPNGLARGECLSEDRQRRPLQLPLELCWSEDSAPQPLGTWLGFEATCTSRDGHGGAVQDPPPLPLPAVGWGTRGSSPWQEYRQGSACSEGSMCNYDVCLSPSSSLVGFAPACRERGV